MPPVVTTAAPRRAPRARLTSSLINQLSIGPAFREVAAHLLRLKLQERYPNLHIDPNVVMVGTPSWDVVHGEIVATPPQYRALTDILARQAVLAVPSLFIDGIHFLTPLPITEPPVHLAVRIEDIALIINVLAPVMIRGYQQQQLAFWDQTVGGSGPHWHELSLVLRDLWNVSEVHGWTDEDCQMARQVAQAPDLAHRATDDSFGTHAYVLDVDQVDDQGNATHLNEHLVSVVIGKQDGHEVILAHSMLLGFRKYATLDALGQDLPLLLDTAITHKKIQWRLVEPDGDFFDYLACTLVTMQIEAIGAIDFSDLRGQGVSPLALAGPPGAVPYGESPGQDIDWLQQALPNWLADASISDMNSYSRYMKDLSALNTFYQGKSYDEGIAPIEQYALDKLEAEIRKDHPDATNLSLDTLQLKVQSPVVVGLFPLPWQFDTTLYSMSQLALQNLIDVPLGIKSLEHNPPRALPEWLTVDYLETLISRIDIGNAYPRLIKSTLLDDPAQADRRGTLYAYHLGIQLPLLALQAKIRREFGIDERGFRFVAAAMEAEKSDRQVDDIAIVVRPLALLPSLRLNRTADIVANMFVIGPQDPASGPCLLYRPLLDKPLTQYPSPANLVYAIQQSPDLRESVLAWLPDDVRDDYSHYVFPTKIPSPWTVAEVATNPLKLASLSGPLQLGGDAIDGNLFTTLYNANANALITLADRQAVSNAEARWATFRRAGWAIFNGVLPFLGRTVNTAAWVWQIMDQLEALKDAKEHPTRQSPWAALSDLLLNLGMAIALHAASRTSPRPSSAAESTEERLAPPISAPKAEPLTIRQLPTVTPEQLPYDHPRPLHTSGALNNTPVRLGIVLDRFKVPRPDTLGTQISTAGPHLHLYQGGQKYYAPVGERWFEVQVDENDRAIIVDPSQPLRTGPPLIHNRQGQWFVDTRLRLRGGGPIVLARKATSLAEQRASTLKKQLSNFHEVEKGLQQNLDDAHGAMEGSAAASSGTMAEANRRAYLRTLKNICRTYETALQGLKQISIHEFSPRYAERALRYVKNQAAMTLNGVRETGTRFTPRMQEMLPKIVRQAQMPQERYIDEARLMNDLCAEMLKHLEYMDTRFDELRQLGEDGAILRQEIQREMPAYKSVDVRSIQVTMARNLCLAASSTISQSKAWNSIDRIVDTADLAVLGLRDTVYERSESRMDERIDILNHLVEQFQMLDEQLEDFSSQYAEYARGENVQALQDQLKRFAKDTTNNLSLVSAEREVVRRRGKPMPAAAPLQRKIIRTRHAGLLIGKPRLDWTGQDTGLVDIISPVTEKVVATYREKDGIWLRHWATPPTTPPMAVFAAASEGQALLDDMPAFLERAERLATTPKRTACGIEYLFRQQAYELESTRNVISHALAQGEASEKDIASAKFIDQALKTQENDLFRRSDAHMSRMLKESPPTVASVEWLKRHNAITITQTKLREPLTTAPKLLFLDEYLIRDRSTKDILWYAQFHYTESWISPERYVSGRLKTVEEQGAASDSASISSANEWERLAYLRSEISLKPAQDLFFEVSKAKSRWRFWQPDQ